MRFYQCKEDKIFIINYCICCCYYSSASRTHIRLSLIFPFICHFGQNLSFVCVICVSHCENGKKNIPGDRLPLATSVNFTDDNVLHTSRRSAVLIGNNFGILFFFEIVLIALVYIYECIKGLCVISHITTKALK